MPVKYVRRENGIAYRAYGDGSGGVLLDLDTSLYFGVNAIGALVWDLIGSGTELSRIVGELEQRFDSPPNLAEDVAEFIEELTARNLVEVVDSPVTT